MLTSRKLNLQHTRRRIDCASLRNTPFAHCVIDDIFEANTYTGLLTSLPAFEQLEEFYKGRYTLLFEDERLAEASPYFKNFIVQFCTEEHKLWWLLKFKDEIDKRFSDFNWVCDNTSWYARVSMDKNDMYSIGPHTDQSNKVVSLIYYLPKDKSLYNAGTTIYQSKQQWKMFNSERLDKDDFDAVEKVLFLPNRVFAFVPSQSSWHGVEEFSLNGQTRNTLQVFIVLKGTRKIPTTWTGERIIYLICKRTLSYAGFLYHNYMKSLQRPSHALNLLVRLVNWLKLVQALIEERITNSNYLWR